MMSLKNMQRTTKTGHFYTDPKLKSFMKKAKEEVQSQWNKPVLEKIDNLTCVFYNRDKRNHDLGNELDTLLDVIKGIIVKDDNQFCISSIQVEYGGVDKENPRTELWIDF